jgi:hypothetical protein
MEEEVSQVWVIVTELKLLPRKRFCGEYTLRYLANIVQGEYVRETTGIESAMQFTSAETAKDVMSEYLLKYYPDAFAMLVSETKTIRDLHYLDPNSILHQKIQALVDERYSEKEVVKNSSSTEETPDSTK